MGNKDKGAQAPPEWAVLIFMSPGLADHVRVLEINLSELQRAELSGRAKFAVLVSSLDGRVATHYDVARGTGDSGAMSQIIHRKAYDASDGKSGVLRRFLVDWFRADDGANRKLKTMLVLWGHAQGVASALSSAGSPLYTALGEGGFGYSPVTGDVLTASDIAAVIAAARREQPTVNFELLAFDSCFMSTSEAAYELRGQAKYLLASQSAIPLAGLDYTALGNTFAFPRSERSEMNTLEVATEIMNQVGQDPDAPRTLALVSLNVVRQSEFRNHLTNLTDHLLRVLGLDGANRGNRAEWMRVRAAFEQASWHQVRQFIDLPNLCRRLSNYCHDVDLRNAAIDLTSFLEERVPKLGRAGLLNDDAASMILDTRSAPPWLFGGLSIYSGWLVPTPEESEAGAWNAALRYEHYAAHALFRRPRRKQRKQCRWHLLAWDESLLSEGQRNAFYRELRALRERFAKRGAADEDTRRAKPEGADAKPPDGGFFSEEQLFAAQSEGKRRITLPLRGFASRPPKR